MQNRLDIYNDQLSYEEIEDLQRQSICFICKAKTTLVDSDYWRKVCLSCHDLIDKHRERKHCIVCTHLLDKNGFCPFCKGDHHKAKERILKIKLKYEQTKEKIAKSFLSN